VSRNYDQLTIKTTLCRSLEGGRISETLLYNGKGLNEIANFSIKS